MGLAALLELRTRGTMRVFALSGQPVSVGRAEDNVVVLEDGQVSRHHARIEWVDSEARLMDLGSANGTVVNGEAVAPNVMLPIAPGDAVQIAGFQLVLRQAQEESAGRQDVTGRPLPSGKAAVLVYAEPGSVTLSVAAAGSTKLHQLDAETATIGRDPSSDIHIQHPVVSGHHARVERVAHGYQIRDVGSANGLVCQGAQVSELLLADGDALWIGNQVALIYKLHPSTAGVAAAERPEAEPAVETPPVAERMVETPPVPERVVEKPAVPEPVVDQPAPVHATMLGMEAPVGGLRRVDFAQRTELSIGRSPENDLQLNYPTVSWRHARIARAGSGLEYRIEDLGSTNGTIVNDQVIEPGKPHPLQAGNTFRIGPIKLIFAPEAIQLVDESRNLRLDALHLNQMVGKGVNLLQDISLAILPREFVAIVGVSGAGKSTLLTALAGFRPASDGTVLVNQTDLYRHFDAYRTDLGYVPQDDIIHRTLTTEKALDYAARLRLPADIRSDERRQVVTDEMAALGLLERRNVPVGRLSGGQRKRVSIGVERLTRPGLFFLDEATSGLDPGTENQLMRLLRDLANEGQTILLITHATKNVMQCDQVVFLARGGNLAYFGPPAEALSYFGVQEFDEIYEKLTAERSPEEWAAHYRNSAQYREYVVGRLRHNYGELLDVSPEARAAQAKEVAPGARSASGRSKAKGSSGLRQFGVLTARYLDIIRTDRTNLLLLLLLAPILGAMDLIAWPRDTFDPLLGDASRVMVMLFLASIIPFLIGALSSVREIVKEKAIYQRERTVNLKIVPYLLSKVAVGLLFALFAAAALLILKLVSVDFSHLGVKDLALFFLLLVLAVLSGVMWGLLISAVAPREEQAMSLVIIIVVVQMVFSGGILPLDQLGTAGKAIGYATSSKWTFDALVDVSQVERGDCTGPSLDNCLLSGVQAYGTDAEKQVVINQLEDRYGEVLQGDVTTSIVAQLAIMVGLFVLLAVIQKRKDVI